MLQRTGVVHSSALWNLRKESTWTAELIATAVDSASKMEDLIAHLHGVWAERGLSARVPLHHGRPDSLARHDSLAALRGGREALQAFRGPGSPPAATRETIETVLSIITSLHHELFLKLRVREVNAGICRPPLENALSDLASAISRDEWRIAIREKIERGQLEAARWGETAPVIGVVPSGAAIPISHRGEAWVIWNATVQNCFRELMMNVLYSSQPLPDQRCDASIAVSYSPDGAIVTLENAADPIEQAERPRSGLRDALSELGIECVHSPPTAVHRRFSVAVTLPFAGKLEASRKALASRGHR